MYIDLTAARQRRSPLGGDGRQQPTWSVDVAPVRGGGHAAQVTAAAGPCV